MKPYQCHCTGIGRITAVTEHREWKRCVSVTSQCVWMMVNMTENKIKRRKTVSPLTAFCIHHKMKGAEISLCRLFVSEAQTYNLWISTVAAVHCWVDCFNYCLWKWDQRKKKQNILCLSKFGVDHFYIFITNSQKFQHTQWIGCLFILFIGMNHITVQFPEGIKTTNELT